MCFSTILSANTTKRVKAEVIATTFSKCIQLALWLRDYFQKFSS